MKLSKVIGIISWFPEDYTERKQRLDRFCKLLKGINKFFPGFPVIIIAQNWKDYIPAPQDNDFIIYHYGKLGILQARKELRKRFLERNYDYLIMFDDDAIISELDKNSVKEYLKRIDQNPNGFAFVKNDNPTEFVPYAPSQLNLCAVSRYIYEREPMVDVDAQKDEGYEDTLFSFLLHIKYSELEFDIPEGVKSLHFKNPRIIELGGEVPSTWARVRYNGKKRNWKKMEMRTRALQQYILANKDFPVNVKEYLSSLGLWN